MAAKRKKAARKAPRRKAAPRRRKSKKPRAERALFCRVGMDLVSHNPLTGKKFAKPRCVVVKKTRTGRDKLETKAPKSVDASKTSCNKGYRYVKVNPKTGRPYAAPRCATMTKGGKLKTHAPKRPRNLPKNAVIVSDTKKVSGGRVFYAGPSGTTVGLGGRRRRKR